MKALTQNIYHGRLLSISCSAVPSFSSDVELECLVQSLQILPFSGGNGYRFQEKCEYELVTTCSPDGSQHVPHVQVNFKNENLVVDDIAIQWMDRVASIFHNSSLLNISGGRVVISGNGISLGIETVGGNVTVLKNFDLGAEPFLSINISSTSDSLNQLCGLCGDRQGNLRLKNGQIANPDMPQEVAMFVADFRVQSSDRIFQNIRPECGK